jgi:4-amino-4-deoxy-L-arabinose transferase-like glycosyltransferase
MSRGNLTGFVDVLTPADVSVHSPATRLSRPMLLALWIASGVLLLLFLGRAPVQRTQEARVMETAREMLDAPAQQWLIPHLNGHLRLRKPPLNYWLTAISFQIFGVNPGPGRIPTALGGWLMIAVTYLAGKRFFGQRTGLFAAAALLGSYMFFRYTRLAETDALSALGVTVAMWALWRGAVAEGRTSEVLWFHLSAVAIAWAAMSKGPPAFYPIVFLLALCAIERSASPLWKFLRSGAAITLIVLALGWWAYAYFGPGARQIQEELRTVATGEDHGGPFYIYFPALLWATAPWTGFVVFGLIAAGTNVRSNRRVQILLAWAGAIFIPLLFVGNRQAHYLFPVLPPLMLITGWALDAALSGALPNQRRTVKIIAYATAIVLALGGVGVALISRMRHMPLHRLDLFIGASIVVAALLVLTIGRARGATAGCCALAVAVALLMPMIVGIWAPDHFERDPRDEVVALRQHFGDRPYYFYGNEISLPMCFAMRQEIPAIASADAARAIAQSQPESVLLVLNKAGRTPAAPPRPFVERFSKTTGERVLVAYQPADSATQP